MSQGNREALAAEYVLGTLEPNARESFAQALEQEPELQKLVSAWEGRLASLEDGITPVEPPAGLWDNIGSALEAAIPEDENVTIREAEGLWQPIAEGAEKKVLFFDPSAKTQSFLLRLAPGTRLPAHHHTRVEECLMIEGDFSIGDLNLNPGDYHVAAPGTEHAEVYSKTGALLYIRAEIHELAS